MPSSDPAQRFEDILANIARIEEHTAGVNDETAFEESHLVYDAVERCLERISEAAKKLGPVAEAICVESIRIWYVVQDDLPPLKAATEAALLRLQEGKAP